VKRRKKESLVCQTAYKKRETRDMRFGEEILSTAVIFGRNRHSSTAVFEREARPLPERKVHRIQWTLGNGVEEERNKKPNFFIQAQKDNRFLEKVVQVVS
jgi:hypothetical protein